jgi:hypothetical protein
LFVIPSAAERICGAPFVCPAPTGPQTPLVITEPSWKHQPLLFREHSLALEEDYGRKETASAAP